MEQNNYAVGEQRERDTKGWSDSEANKLRSFPPTHHTDFSLKYRSTIIIVVTSHHTLIGANSLEHKERYDITV